ncbi:transcriptional regulator PpsR [Alsobacter sp. KACC 23698]|uniref:Transcriptional regulator PpsR n=1 Tax=Alsobacter sp. KACC 23698 TaxID=3149229 RepID=A0AAU7JDV4_9HYPH
MSITDRAPKRQEARPFGAEPKLVGSFDADTAAEVISAAADLALVVDSKGIIRDLAVGSDDLAPLGLRVWRGAPLADTLGPDSRHKAAELLAADAAAGPVEARWRHLNHVTPRGDELPIRYAPVRLAQGHVLLVGRDMQATVALQRRLVAAEQARVRDYARISGAEGRYRMLFQASSEAVLIIDPLTARVLEANPAACEVFGKPAQALCRLELPALFEPNRRAGVESLIAAVRLTGKGDEVATTLTEAEAPFRLSVSLFRQESGLRCLVRMVPAAPSVSGGGDPAIASIIDRMPEGFILAGMDRRIRVANLAFLEAIQLSVPEQVRGEPLDRWLGRTSVDLDVLMSALRDKGSVRQFVTVIRGEYGSREEVEITAVALDGVTDPCVGLTVRVSPGATALDGRERPKSAARLTELIGQMPLKSLVRETTDEVERRCIETALRLTKDNRASAAEMLGLSRQSLYAKLRRFGLAYAEDDAEQG